MNDILAIFLVCGIIGAMTKTERPYLILWAFGTPIFYLIFGFKSIFINLGFSQVELFSGILPMAVCAISWFKLTRTERQRAWKYAPKIWWVFIGYYFLSLTWSNNVGTGVRTVMELFFPSVLYLIAFNLIQADFHLDKYFKWMMIINVIIAIADIYVAADAWKYIEKNGGMQDGSIGYRTITAYFNVTMATLLLLQMMEKFKWTYLALFLVDATLLLLSASRTPTFSFIGGILVAILLRRSLVYSAIGTFAMAILVGLIFILPSKSKFVDDGENLNTKDSGRSFFQQFFSNEADRSPVIGFGAGGTETYAKWITQNITLCGAPHNEYLRVRFDGGYIGLVLFYLGLADLVITGLRMGRWLKGYFALRAVLVMTPVMFAISCTNDNTFFYFYVFLQYLFVFMGFGARLAYEERVRLGYDEIILPADEYEVILEESGLAPA